jgi:hypothetical protein
VGARFRVPAEHKLDLVHKAAEIGRDCFLRGPIPEENCEYVRVTKRSLWRNEEKPQRFGLRKD